jgi:triosephosphate isomerase (TIM)
MKRRKIAAANWKMNLNWVEAFDLASAVKNKCGTAGSEVIIFPSYPYLQMCSVIFQDTPHINVGAQDCSAYPKGAFTGEVSAGMIASAGAKYVIIGHSERRQYFHETSALLSEKIALALSNNLQVIYCFGEQLPERKSGQHFNIVRGQLVEVLSDFPADKLDHLILAYEPVWAIGTGETATPQQAQEMHEHVRLIFSEIFGQHAASKIPVLYGGSCNAANARELFACADVDGGLVGGASLKPDDFATICNSFS